jgi:hypothetical protein
MKTPDVKSSFDFRDTPDAFNYRPRGNVRQILLLKSVVKCRDAFVLHFLGSIRVGTLGTD